MVTVPAVCRGDNEEDGRQLLVSGCAGENMYKHEALSSTWFISSFSVSAGKNNLWFCLLPVFFVLFQGHVYLLVHLFCSIYFLVSLFCLKNFSHPETNRREQTLPASLSFPQSSLLLSGFVQNQTLDRKVFVREVETGALSGRRCLAQY